jgi:hypothetical protein
MKLLPNLTPLLMGLSVCKEKNIKFDGQEFPLKIVKRFYFTFNEADQLKVYLLKDSLQFKWKNGQAHINNLVVQKKLKKGRES